MANDMDENKWRREILMRLTALQDIELIQNELLVNIKELLSELLTPGLQSANKLPESRALERTKEVFPKNVKTIVKAPAKKTEPNDVIKYNKYLELENSFKLWNKENLIVFVGKSNVDHVDEDPTGEAGRIILTEKAGKWLKKKLKWEEDKFATKEEEEEEN